MKVKIATGADLMYIATLLVVILIIVMYCIPLGDGTLSFRKWDFDNTDITIAQYITLTTHLSNFKLAIIMFFAGVGAFLIDRFIIIPFLNRYTKIGKIERKKLKEEGAKYKKGDKEKEKKDDATNN